MVDNFDLLSDDLERQNIELPLPPIPNLEIQSRIPDGTIGDPSDKEFGRAQESQTSCAVIAAGSVIEAMTGNYHSEGDLIAEAEANSLYVEGVGTIPENFGKLLGVYRIPYHVNESGTMQDIVKELAYGRKVLVAVDGPELWGQEPEGWLGDVLDWMQETLGIANHAVWVTAVDVDDPNNIKIIVNDSGPFDGSGIGKSHSLDEFIDAAKDSRFHYVATNEAAPGTFPHEVPDPDLAVFPEIKDYYEIRYSEKLAVSEVEDSISTSGLFASQSGEALAISEPGDSSEFDIGKMSLGDKARKFLVEKALSYNFDNWLQNEASRSGLTEKEIELAQTPWDDANRLELAAHLKALDLYKQWIARSGDNVGEIRDFLEARGVKMEIHDDLTFDQLVSKLRSSADPKFAAIDSVEVRFRDNPLHSMSHHFWEKFNEVEKHHHLVMFIYAVGRGLYGVAAAAVETFDLIGESPDDLVQVKLGEDRVTVIRSDGTEAVYSYEAFKEASRDARFGCITIGNAPVVNTL